MLNGHLEKGDFVGAWHLSVCANAMNDDNRSNPPDIPRMPT
jgi:hypothetical protein